LEIEEGWIKKNSTFGCHMDLTVKNLVDRISICESLLKWNEIEPVLKRLITVKNRSCMTIMYEKVGETNGDKTRIDVRKSDAVCMKWDWKGIVYYELLPPGDSND